MSSENVIPVRSDIIGSGARLESWRRTFFQAGVGYLVFIAILIGVRSWQRPTVVAFAGQSGAKSSSAASDSKLELQDFYRVQTKEGKNQWEIRAQKARYLAKEDLTYVMGAELLVNRKKGEPVTITSDAAKLSLHGDDLERAELAGNVIVRSGTSVTMRTQLANFSNTDRLVTAPGDVELDGGSWKVDGSLMEMYLDEDVTVINENVRSRFDRGESVTAVLGEFGHAARPDGARQGGASDSDKGPADARTGEGVSGDENE